MSALVLAGLVSFAGLAASNAELHKLLHHNAGDPGHFCFITLLEHNLVETADGEVKTVTAVLPVAVPWSAPRVFLPHFDYESPPGRAPPAFFCSLVS
jgi:hypothetical protein